MFMFEEAMRRRLRFDYKGSSPTEDLFQAPLQTLKNIYADLYAEQQEKSQTFFWDEQGLANKELDLKVKIVRHIIESKIAEQKKAEAAQEEKAYEQKIMNIIEAKKDAKLLEMPLEELENILKKKS